MRQGFLTVAVLLLVLALLSRFTMPHEQRVAGQFKEISLPLPQPKSDRPLAETPSPSATPTPTVTATRIPMATLTSTPTPGSDPANAGEQESFSVSIHNGDVTVNGEHVNGEGRKKTHEEWKAWAANLRRELRHSLHEAE